MTEIDHMYTREVVCPYCGYELSDSWELPDTGECECDECNKTFLFYRDVDITWITRKVEE